MTYRAGLVLLLLLLGVPHAAAHANYYASEPPRGARLDQVPRSVNVTLSEAVDPGGSSLEVRDAEGNLVSVGPTRHTGGATPGLSVDLRTDLGPGAYLATWRALSTVDGHVTSGSWGFAVGGFEPPEAPTAIVEYAPASAALRAVSYAGYALGIGALGYALLVDPRLRGTPRGSILGRCLALGALLVALGVAGVFHDTWSKTGMTLRAFSATEVGNEFLFRLGAALLTLLVAAPLWSRPPPRGSLAVLSGLFLLDAVGSSWFVHSANRGPGAVAIDLVHLVSVSLWLGGLALFLWHVKEQARGGTYEEVLRVGRRFSRLALACVLLLGVSGIASTLLILGTHPFREPLRVVGHPYGAFLLAKVLLFAAMLFVAGVNRFVFLGTAPGRDPPAPLSVFASLLPRGHGNANAFGSAVAAEATLGVVVLVLAGFLTAISPPSGQALEGGSSTYDLKGYGDAHNATLHFAAPPTAGTSVNVSLSLETSHDGAPLETAVRVRVTLQREDGNGTGGETYNARLQGGGRWLVGDVLFAQAGKYRARIDVQTEEVFRDVIEIGFSVAGAASGTPSTGGATSAK